MTTLDQTAADRSPSAPAAAITPSAPVRPDGAGSAAPADGASRCSIAAAAAEGWTGGSVPRPRGGGRSGGAAGSDGSDWSDGAAGDVAGPERADGGDGRGEGFVRLQQPPAARDRSVPVLRAAQEELRTVATRRPAPSRRLRRMHPQAAGPLQPDTTRSGPAPTANVPSVPGPRTGDDRAGAETGTATGAATVSGTDGAARSVTGAEAPLGVLISGTPHQPEAVGRFGPTGLPARAEERPAVRAAAELVRLGRGTCLVVLPAWRPAIAVSVPTERLLSATGLAYERLAGAQLSVVINPGALHDRELELRDWQAGPPGRTGRRGGRRTGRPGPARVGRA
ncbi:hypothetical protein ACFVUH_35810 [Kitasatospora sp. NPDC058032]|uniref:hypothetical protein n=1 Tax=Kitasatospora sp. NPDC058032 TaxID=3346307 RepID=UPI0036DF5FD5